MRTVLPPSLETGDSVEYEAVLHIQKWAKPDDFWFVHFLTGNVPVISETVVLDLPADREVVLYESSTTPGKTETINERRIKRWVIASPERAKASLETAPPLFAVSSMRSWDAFGQWMYSLNKNAAAPTPEIASLDAKLTANKSSEQERIAALYTYVATKVRYVSVSFGLGRVQPHTASVVLHNAYGDCKDQTALLSALLAAAGFKTYAVLTTPAVGVQVRDVPTPDQFNHEFTAIDTKAGLVFLDTSTGPVPPGVLPAGVRGYSALLVGEKTSSIIDIPIQSPVPKRIAAALKGRVTLAGAFEGSSRFEFQGVAEAEMRRVFLDAGEVEKETILRALAGPEFRNANLRQISSSDPIDLTKPFWVQCEISDKDFFPPADTSMRITFELPGSPAALFEGLGKPSTPLSVESFAFTKSMDLIIDPSITITNGMPVHRKAAFGGFDSEFSYQDGHLQLARAFQLNGAPIAPSDWDSFLDFMRASSTETARGFTLERHSGAVGTSNLNQAMHQGAEAFQRRDYPAAKRAYLEATKLEPKSRLAWNNLGRVYAALHEYSNAEEAYKRQIEINPNDPYAYNNLGIVYRALKREDDAVVWFRKQIAVSPRDRYAHDNLSISFAAENQWEYARDEAAIAAEITPEDAARWVRLGRAQLKTSRIDEAGKSFDRALALVHDAMAENNIAYYLADAGIKLDQAWQLVSGTLNPEARLACQPETLSEDDKCSAELRRIATMLDTAGWVLYRQGKLSEAEPYLSSSYAIAPRAAIAIHLSILLATLGRLDESLKYFADANSRADFSRVDSSEARRELARALGGQIPLDSRLKEIAISIASPGATARVIALVDGQGKVLDAKSAGSQIAVPLVGEAKSLTLLPISWPEHSIRSIRTVEFRHDGAKWSPVQTYVAPGAEPPAPVR
jgi:tetratricopeptide (TPR) repeat protein